MPSSIRSRTLLLLALAALWATPSTARAADAASTNRIQAPPCPVRVSGPGVPAIVDCQLNGNAFIRSWGEAVNTGGVLQALSGAEVRFEAVERDVTTQNRWLDSVVWLGGAVPAQVVFEARLAGDFAIDIGAGSISPSGVEQGRVAAQLQLRAGTELARVDAAMARNSSGGSGRWTEAVMQPVTLALAWVPSATGDTLAYEQLLVTHATAANAWFRNGAGVVNAQADFRAGSGLVSVRWLDTSGQDLGNAVQWAWTHELTLLPALAPVPEPGTPARWLAGLAALAVWVRRRPRAVSAPSPSAGCRRP